eukprot:Seg1956.8 transcript_id=Seg1956.8/GoldUCD/mRNA.D3Y31 product="hypothetical protein" protein_id=Seg1956.8/GoldUCD/D3Y31
MVHACFFCGNGFRNDTDLYLHQTQHCLKSFKCRYCDSSFDDLRSCQRHELQSHGHFGISTEAVPTLRAQHKFVNYMKYDARPWITDVDEVVSKQGHYMDYVHRVINNSREVLSGRGIDVSDEGVHNQIVGNAVRSVRKAAIEKVKDAYMKNAASIMTHSTRGNDGQMLTYNVHLVGSAPFNDQIDDILQKVYVENQQNMPYQMAMAFGFFLHTPKTGKYSYWYANTHLSHEQGANGSRSDILQQKDNIWQIRNRSDMDACANDIKNTDFFTLVRNAFEESSTVLVRSTNVKVQIYPLGDNAIGRGEDDDDEEDDYEEEDDDEYEDEDDDVRSRRRENPFVRLEAEVEDDVVEEDDEEEDEEEDQDQERDQDQDQEQGQEQEQDQSKLNDKKIGNFLRGRKHGRGKNVYSLSKRFRRNNGANDSMCFFHCLAFMELAYERGIQTVSGLYDQCDVDEEVKIKSKELFDIYCKTHSLTDVSKATFNGVSVRLIPILEHLFHYRIHVYRPMVRSEDGKVAFSLVGHAKSSFVYNSKKTMSLILHANHFYLILDKSRVINKNLKCLNCGKNFAYVRNLHTHAQKCKFTKSKHCYAKGSVDTSQLLLSKIKQCFAVPDEILPPLSYLEGDERLLHPEENDMYFSKRFATFDFESKLQRTTTEEIRDRRLSYIKEF